MQRIKCTNCGKVLKVSSKLIGKKGRCPKCSTKISFVEEEKKEVVVALKMEESGVHQQPKQELIKPIPPTPRPVVEHRPIPQYRPPVRKVRWVMPTVVCLGMLTLAGVAFRFAFPDEAKSVWAKMFPAAEKVVEEKAAFASLDMTIEKEALPIIEKIWEDYPKLDDGQIDYEDGYIAVTQAGHNEIDAQVGRLIGNELRKKVPNNEFVKHIDDLQKVLEKLDDESSPLHLISGLSKTSAKAKVQEQIFTIAVDAWLDNFRREKKKIEKLSSSLLMTKIHEFIVLDEQVSEKTAELIAHSKPSEKTKFGDELFDVMRSDLIEKFELASAGNFYSVFNIIKSRLKDKDKTKEATDKVSKFFELYHGFVANYKVWSDDDQKFVVSGFDKLPESHQLIAKRREERIVEELNVCLGDLTDDESKKLFAELVREYPESKPLLQKIGNATNTTTTTVSLSSTINESSNADNKQASAAEDEEKPSSEDEEKPNSEDAEKQSSEDKEKPGSEDEEKPGSEDEEKPGSEDEEKPSSEVSTTSM